MKREIAIEYPKIRFVFDSCRLNDHRRGGFVCQKLSINC